MKGKVKNFSNIKWILGLRGEEGGHKPKVMGMSGTHERLHAQNKPAKKSSSDFSVNENGGDINHILSLKGVTHSECQYMLNLRN